MASADFGRDITFLGNRSSIYDVTFSMPDPDRAVPEWFVALMIGVVLLMFVAVLWKVV